MMKVLSQIKPEQIALYSDMHRVWDITVSDEHNIESDIVQEEKKLLWINEDADTIVRQLHTDGTVILDTKVHVLENLDWQISVEEDCILMEFLLEGDPETTDTKTGDVVRNIAGTHNLQYVNNFTRCCKLRKSTIFDSFCILLSKNFYFTLIGKTNKVHNEFATHIQAGQSTGLSDNFLPMNYDMHRVIDNMRSCTRKGNFQRLCLEIKVLELILLQLEQFHYQFVEVTPKQHFHESDILKIRAAKNILEESYNNPPTIKQLSYLVGVNELKLKKGFKELYDSTIHAYISRLRMEKANQLVKAQNLQVQEVAMELGYKNPSHFSAAFKKHFGFLPTEMVG